MDILSAGLTLLLIMDPLGNIPLFLSVLNTVESESRRRKILIRELFLALLVLLLFLFAGEYLLKWLNLRQEAVSIAGGIVLFLISLRMIFPSEKGIMGEMPEGEPFFVPLAIPLLAGPSTLAMLILLARSQPERIFEWLVAVLGAWAVTSLIMLSSTKLNKLLGKRGLIAVERLMGMVLVAISVQMLMDGISTYLNVLTIR
ncbi:MAG: YhgN family NAAT transporter [SAR324 cluster bacterium]|jgi:multiple antibiotic resistance protein|nr:YhgN family NAAT transporter [SAR324 cluster bacterium]MDP7047196.1 YhgN family NAAT transporter [SAR324 cluster bacterium]MEC7887090.1 YhgN family NAAT transporter [SAR324 cluster bacterium]MEC8940175.1 YhgN family NAAT transporter [SAR324 cluster bacterium]MEC8981204.1 YhgN family NAAT transporter [SAR324 cluster bacterium]